MKLALQKKTKIVATISDIRCEVDFLKELYETGMNVVRVNTAHQTTESSLKILENVRKVSDKIGILVDTKGPEIRTTPMADGKGFDVRTGDTIKVAGNPEAFSSSEMLYMNYAGFVKDVNVGNSILIDDGELKFTVVEKTEEYLTCRAENGGTVKGKKTVNVPAVPMTLPSLSKRDVEYINWAIDNNIDFIAHSFVRSKEDALAVQQIISERKSSIKLIAKIENQQGVDNIEEILEHVYGIMVARGDLGVEIEAEKIPGIQKMLIEKAQLYEKPVIIATQMLHTMIEHPRPTRAEVTDVANAIYQRTDAIMLSGETAYGAYPVEAVRTMTKVAIETEHLLKPHTGQKHTGLKDKVAVSIAKSAVQISEELPIKAFITDSYYGRTPRYLSAYRSNIPVYALCYLDRTMRELSLSYGVYCYPAAPLKNNDEFSRYAAQYLFGHGWLTEEDMVIIMAGNFYASGATTFLEVGVVKDLNGAVNPVVDPKS